MEKVIVLGLRGCGNCNALIESLNEKNIPFEFKDADLKEYTNLADRMEALLKTHIYPMVILEGTYNTKYFYLVDTLKEAKETPISYASKIGCISTDSMATLIKKYLN